MKCGFELLRKKIAVEARFFAHWSGLSCVRSREEW